METRLKDTIYFRIVLCNLFILRTNTRKMIMDTTTRYRFPLKSTHDLHDIAFIGFFRSFLFIFSKNEVFSV